MVVDKLTQMQSLSLRQWITPLVLGTVLLCRTALLNDKVWWSSRVEVIQSLISWVLTLCTLIGLLVAVFVLCFTLLVLIELFGKWLWRVIQRLRTVQMK